MVYTNFIVRLNWVDSLAVLSLNGFTALEVSLFRFTETIIIPAVGMGVVSDLTLALSMWLTGSQQRIAI